MAYEAETTWSRRAVSWETSQTFLRVNPKTLGSKIFSDFDFLFLLVYKEPGALPLPYSNTFPIPTLHSTYP